MSPSASAAAHRYLEACRLLILSALQEAGDGRFRLLSEAGEEGADGGTQLSIRTLHSP